MKIVHKKKVHRCMSFFRNHFGFREPYQVLIDGTFCLAALEGQVRVSEQLSKYFQCQLKLLTTQCVIIEMERIGPAVAGALRICKQFLLHKCGHESQAVSAEDCIKSMINPNGQNNPARYIVASQDNNLKAYARDVPGTPVLYLHNRSPTLEKPSEASSGLVEENALTRNDDSFRRLLALKNSAQSSDQSGPKFKKRRPKGPNPLSCKKKKRPKSTQAPTETQEVATEAKKKRKRIKIPKHVKEALLSAANT